MATIPETKFATMEPSASTGQTLMRPPEDLGGQQVAQEIRRGGALLAAYAINVQKQEMVADYYEKRRLIDESGWAASEAVTGDEEADRKLWQRFETETKQIAQSSKWKDANRMLGEHINSVLPNWSHAFRTKSLGIRADNAKDQLRLEWSMALENSDMKTATEIVDKALRLGVISQTEYDNYIKVAPSESHLLRAERFLAEGNNKDVLSELDKTKGMKLTTDQLKRRTSLKLDAEKAKTSISRELKNDVLGKVAAGMSLNEVGDMIQQTAGLDQVEMAELMNIAIAGEKIWQDTGINPWTQTTEDGYEKLSNLLIGIRKQEIKTPDEIDKTWLENEEPNFSFNHWLMAQNALESMQKPTASGYSRSHPIMRQYLGTASIVGLLDEAFQDSKGNLVDRPGYVQAVADLEQYAKDVWGKPNYAKLIDDYYLELTKGRKKEKTKGILARAFSFEPLTSGKSLKLGMEIGFGKRPFQLYRGLSWAGRNVLPLLSEPPIEVENLEDVEKLKSGTKFVYEGKEYTRK